MALGLLEAAATGIFNCSGLEMYDRYTFAVKCARILGYNVILIKGINSSREVTSDKARRGLNLGLKINKCLNLLDKKYHPNSLKESLEDWISNQRGKVLKLF